MTPILSAKKIVKSFSTQASPLLKGISLEVKAGESVAIVGKSGEGKSTLLHILGTLEAPSSGELSLLGQTPSSRNVALLRNRHIGFIFQAFNLLEEYTLLDNVLMPARIGRNLTPSSTERALSLLSEVGLVDKRDLLAKNLSGGEKQRVATARALLNEPDLLLADEPTGNLDSSSAERVLSLLFKASQELNKAVIIVTHDEGIARNCDRIFKLKEGLLWSY